MNEYRYTDCGLDHVCITDALFLGGADAVHIPNVNGLHRAIALGIVTRGSMMDGREMRFLRTELGMTQAELAA
jgi:hypothetical protein